MRGYSVALGGLLTLALTSPARAIEIADVSHAPRVLDPRRGEEVAVRFRLSEEADVILRIYDGRDLQIREVAKHLPAGAHTLSWDGRDFQGRPVSPEAYAYTLWARTPSGDVAEHDLTDLSGNQALPRPEVDWDPARHELRYTLPAAARVSLRAGLANDGPLLRTLLDWVARGPGEHVEAWDGFDSNHLLDAGRHPDLQFSVVAWALPANAIVVGPSAAEVKLIADLDRGAPKRMRKRIERPDPRAVHQQPIESRRDPRLLVSIVGVRDPTDGAVPEVRGTVSVRVEVDPRDRARILDQRFEAGFFLDGKFMFENEVGYLPMTWQWDTTRVNPGEHFVTANVWGYSGQFGTATMRVRVAR